MRLYVDDQRPLPKNFDLLAKTVGEAVKAMTKNDVTFISLDYDILWDDDDDIQADEDWDNRRTGMGVVLWMEENNKWPVDGVAIHSSNPRGIERMRNRIRQNDVEPVVTSKLFYF